MKRILIGFGVAIIALACVPTTPSDMRCYSQSDAEADRKLPAFKYEVRIAVDTCVEDRNHVSGNGDYATLDCKGDGGTYRILLARKEWLDMKRDGTGTTNPGPGK